MIVTACLYLADAFSTQKQLSNAIIAHYGREVALEVFKVIGTADLLGNPIGLLNNYATGVYDFFYEPGKALLSKNFRPASTFILFSAYSTDKCLV